MTYSNPPVLSLARYYITGGSIGDYALFAGGEARIEVDYTLKSTAVDNVDAYNSSLTQSRKSLYHYQQETVSASNGTYLLFGGGRARDSEIVGYVDSFNASLTRNNRTSLSIARHSLNAASAGSYILFAGGNSTSYTSMSAQVDVYDSSLSRSTGTNLSRSRYYLGAGSINNYAVFAGGYEMYNGAQANSSAVDAYDSSGTKLSTVSGLSSARRSPYGVTLGDNLMFCGGSSTTIVDIYDPSLTRKAGTELSVARDGSGGATTVGNYALIAGGWKSNPSSYTDVVDVYKLS